jgi:acetyl esterase/lipase
MSNAAREEPAAARTGKAVAAAKEDYAGMEAVVVSRPSAASAEHDDTTFTGLLPRTVATWLLRPKILPLLQKVTSSIHGSGADLANLNRWE